MIMRRIAITAVLAVAAFTMGAAPAKAVDLPCSTAKLIVPWKAGGGTHVIFSIFEKTIQNLDVTAVRHSSERDHQLSQRSHRLPL
jgi:tripartite-type tricarboxylate transporter receptor subunit TctC